MANKLGEAFEYEIWEEKPLFKLPDWQRLITPSNWGSAVQADLHIKHNGYYE